MTFYTKVTQSFTVRVDYGLSQMRFQITGKSCAFSLPLTNMPLIRGQQGWRVKVNKGSSSGGRAKGYYLAMSLFVTAVKWRIETEEDFYFYYVT